MRVRLVFGIVVVLAVAASTLPCVAQAPEAPAKPVPVLFVPLTVDKPFIKQERLLRDILSARMMTTGKFVETVTAETEKQVQECVKGVNRDANAEQCWVRLGQGQGAEMMVSGEIRGSEKRCSLTIRLTVLETRVSARKYVESLEPWDDLSGWGVVGDGLDGERLALEHGRFRGRGGHGDRDSLRDVAGTTALEPGRPPGPGGQLPARRLKDERRPRCDMSQRGRRLDLSGPP